MRAMVLALLFLGGCVSVTVRDHRDLLGEMRTLEAARGAAIRSGDRPALERIYAEDFSGVAANGQTVTRDQLFAVFTRARGSLGQVTSEVQSARQEGDVAVVTGRLRIDANESRYMHVFRWDEDHWEMISGAATPSAAN